jgi:hypothetical protein
VILRVSASKKPPEETSISKPWASGGMEKATRTSLDRPGLIRSIRKRSLSSGMYPKGTSDSVSN